ncbi:hypothetical protein RhiJN_21159 [Ceratobasidium sp. AG-Ba]|nr:hypothetical protein RhiJN_21159 [Ceratobasidium sp. AG-Ba]
MRGLIAVISFALATTTATAKTLPPYRHLYSFDITLTQDYLVENGPLGSRLGYGIVSGNMTSPTGKTIAKAVSGVGGEQGFVDKNGNLHLQVRAVWQFIDDKKYGYVEGLGIGSLTGNPLEFQRFETDSPSRIAWNGYFIVTNVTLVRNGTGLLGDGFVFGNGV